MSAKAPSSRPVRNALARLRNYLVAGILVTVPALVTCWVFYSFFLSIDGVLAVVPGSWEIRGLNIKALLTSIPGLGAMLTIGTVIVVGFLTTNFLGRRTVVITERVIQRVPILSKVYGAIKQLLEAIFSSDSSRFRDVVYIQYPRVGIWSIAFVTGETFVGASDRIGAECLNVFVPTTPNPTSGFYLMVPAADVVPSGLTVEDAFKLIMSAGIVTPGSENVSVAKGAKGP